MKSKSFHKARFHLFHQISGLEAGGYLRRKKLILLSRWTNIFNQTGVAIFTSRFNYHALEKRVAYKLLAEVP